MCVVEFIIYFKHKTAYDVRMSDWISDVCSSDHALSLDGPSASSTQVSTSRPWRDAGTRSWHKTARRRSASPASIPPNGRFDRTQPGNERPACHCIGTCRRSEEHTSELQSLMRISYAVFCLKKKNKNIKTHEKKRQHTQTKRNN